MAPAYDWLFGPSFANGRKAAVETLAVRPGERTLEVGIGTGLSLPRWPRDAEVVGIDVSPDMLKRAQRIKARHQLDHVQLHLMDAQATSFPDDHFDAIAAMYVVSVVPDLDALLTEMRRVCRPGGRIVIVNHFAKTVGPLRWLERGLEKYAPLLGFNTALPLQRVTETKGLRVRAVSPVNLAGYWTLVSAENVK